MLMVLSLVFDAVAGGFIRLLAIPGLRDGPCLLMVVTECKKSLIGKAQLGRKGTGGRWLQETVQVPEPRIDGISSLGFVAPELAEMLPRQTFDFRKGDGWVGRSQSKVPVEHRRVDFGFAGGSLQVIEFCHEPSANIGGQDAARVQSFTHFCCSFRT